MAVRAILASGLFDARWYASDGTISGSARALAWHYVLRGVSEGRNPSEHFDTNFYLREHPEVGFSAMNPLAHYVTLGREAGFRIAKAPAPGLPRRPLTPENFSAWLTEMAALTAPDQQRPGAQPNPLPELAVAGDGNRQAHYIMLCPRGVLLAGNARLALREALARAPDGKMFFGDEDRIDASGRRQNPWFKPGWDPELMRQSDLTGPATVMHRALLEQLGWNGQVPDAASLRSLSLSAVASGCTPIHVPKILFHRDGSPRLTPLTADVPAPKPLVSIIMPTRDRAKILRVAAEGVLQKTAYGPIELLIVDNGSREAATRRLLQKLAADPRVRVIAAPGPFNWSALNNLAARQARGDVFLLLNNDIEVISPDWLAALVAQAIRPEIGAAGAKLLYPDRTIQHIGLSIDALGCFCHVMRGAPSDDPGLVGELGLVRSVAAVTGACLAIRRDVFEAMGGLEEKNLAVTCNDIDLCLRVRAAGYRVVVAPQSVLVHHEAASRGHDRTPAQMARVLAERDYLRRMWGELAVRDPFLNPNLCWLDGRPALESPGRLIREEGLLF
jgi:GT2 family glycosyltransferase